MSSKNVLGILLALAVSVLSSGAAGAEPLPDTVQLSPELLLKAREAVAAGDPRAIPAYDALRAQADEWLEIEPPSVVAGKRHVAPSGDPHDYVSLGTYVWPDPEKKDGLPWITRDGHKNPLTDEYDRPKLRTLYRSVRDLGFAAWFSGERKYADKAARILRVFFLDPETRMNPNLNHAQFRPGGEKGTRYGIIDTSYFPSSYFFDAVNLLPDSDAWTQADRAGLRKWFADYLDWLETSKLGSKLAQEQKNNIRTGYELQRAAMARFIGDDARARAVLEQFRAVCIPMQIAPDGAQPEEAWRATSLDYSAKNLKFMLQMGQLGQRVGVDVFGYESPDGSSIRRALEALVPFWTGRSEWPHKQTRTFQPNRAYDALRWAALGYGEPRYEKLIGEVEGKPESDWKLEIEQLLWPRLD